eukprot:scaffold4044_cov179-Cylindrotheca_fusiformis.AAC.1
MGQCSVPMRNRLKAHKRWETVNKANDVIGLLEIIVEALYAGGMGRYSVHARVEAARKLYMCNQEKDSAVHIVFPKFYSSGQPFLCSHRDIPPIHLPDPRDGRPIEIPCHPHHLEHKTLGHYKAPSGSFPKQRSALLAAANALAKMIFRSFLFPEEARMVYFAIFLEFSEEKVLKAK